jgi:hypothetical protein
MNSLDGLGHEVYPLLELGNPRQVALQFTSKVACLDLLS